MLPLYTEDPNAITLAPLWILSITKMIPKQRNRSKPYGLLGVAQNLLKIVFEHTFPICIFT